MNTTMQPTIDNSLEIECLDLKIGSTVVWNDDKEVTLQPSIDNNLEIENLDLIIGSIYDRKNDNPHF